mmetsp:Transcript_3925/g.3854  ORF Transcript_3925/g.3854 Transcript_3925/m.3854 type:complete len:176 (-) Transcript_3925:679-1206(-)
MTESSSALASSLMIASLTSPVDHRCVPIKSTLSKITSGSPPMCLTFTLLTHLHDYRVAASGFIHGFRYNCHALHTLLRHKYEQLPLPYASFPKDPTALTDLLIKRFNTSAAMFLQIGTMAEGFIIRDQEVRYMKDLTTFYFKNGPTSEEDDYMVFSMEYGDIQFSNVFAIKRIPD